MTKCEFIGFSFKGDMTLQSHPSNKGSWERVIELGYLPPETKMGLTLEKKFLCPESFLSIDPKLTLHQFPSR